MATSETVEIASTQAFVTLATTDAYAFGALVLGRSLRRVSTRHQLAVMVGPGLSQEIMQNLNRVFDAVVPVNVLDSRDTMNLDLLTRPDLGVTFTKLHCWRLTQYTKAVFLDADTLVVQNIDDLMEREELSAAPDAGWPDCFNSGVFVFRPSLETYSSLLTFAVQHGSFDGGDQGLLNLYFSDWATKDISKHLPFVYNCVSQAFYSYLPAFKQFGKNIKLVHFIGALKPWHHSYNTGTRHVEKSGDIGHHTDFLQLWWDIFMADVRSELDPKLIVLTGSDGGQCTIAGQLTSLSLHRHGGGPDNWTTEQLANSDRQYSWEKGQIDYLGIDAFANIQKRLDEVLATKPEAQSTNPVQPPVLQPSVQPQGGAKPKDKPKVKKPGILKKR